MTSSAGIELILKPFAEHYSLSATSAWQGPDGRQTDVTTWHGKQIDVEKPNNERVAKA